MHQNHCQLRRKILKATQKWSIFLNLNIFEILNSAHVESVESVTMGSGSLSRGARLTGPNGDAVMAGLSTSSLSQLLAHWACQMLAAAHCGVERYQFETRCTHRLR